MKTASSARRRALVRVVILSSWILGGMAQASPAASSPAPSGLPPAGVVSAPTIQTDLGAVKGVVETNGVLAFKGVPYAADTGGENRFLPPRPRMPWSGVYDGSAIGPACPQISNLIGDRAQSEDCLRVSIWTRSVKGRRPIVVWLHGGAYKQGSDNYAAEGADGAAAAASGDYVFVSLTHRLNVMGYLQLGEEFGPAYATSGNVGLLDIAAALSWVHRNAESFGGDPDNVTIAGPSGGGSKVMHAMAMPAMKGLFQHAIVFVGHDLWKRNSYAAAKRSSNAVLAKLGVSPGDIKTLQSLPVGVLEQAALDVYGAYPPDPSWGPEGWVKYDVLSPNIDGKVLPEHPLDAIAHGASRDVDLIVSVDQWTHWTPRRTAPESFDSTLYGRMTRGELTETLRPLLDGQAEDILSGYEKILPGASPSSLLALIVTDRDWWVPALRLAEAKAEGGKPGRVIFNSSGPGAHSYFFGGNFTSAYPRALLGQVQGAYAAFSKTGDPNHPGMPSWPPYTPGSRNVLMLNYDLHVAEDPFQAQRLIWSGVR